MKVTRKPILGTIAVMCAAIGAGCASAQPSQQLTAARTAYSEASQGPAERYAPAELYQARRTLAEAESADLGSDQERQLAYLADRQARRAAAEGATRENQQRLAAANQRYTTLQTEGRVAAERGLNEAQQRLTEEQKARQAAEQRAAQAMVSLQELGQLKEEATETILTISGEVLFKTGQAELLPTAESRLQSVATALKQLDETQTVVVAGYTDSRGSDELNQRLSQERADAVRNYLIDQGVRESQLTAVGKGEANPVANNDTAEGRANNRRVELTIKKLPAARNVE
jgi:outer membrane protein OmpA-like peptidoglycan-associated protein